jgi:sigma-E factor negative regulatory protein RseC
MQEIIKEKGVVKGFDGSTVEVIMKSSEECEECTAKIYCKPTSESKNLLSIPCKDELIIGDLVEVAIKGKTVFLFSLFFYGIPLLILIATILFGVFFLTDVHNIEFYSFVISLLLLAVYYILFNKFIKQNTNFFAAPTIIKTDNSN